MSQKTYILVLITVLAAAVVVNSAAFRGSSFQQLDLMVDVRHEIVSEYVEVADEKKMVDAAVRAMVNSLGDPYTVYLSPEEMPDFDKAIRGTFFGIGAEIDIHENFLRIVTPLEDSPAWKAGVLAGDIVLDIDGKTTEGITSAEAIKRLTGEEGTPVTIRVRHINGKEATITIKRGRIVVPTVKGAWRKGDGHWDYMLDDKNKIGFIRLTQFTEDTVDRMKTAIADLQAAGVKGIILDLRFDPGGLLDAAVQVSDMFLPGGKTIVSIRGRTQRDRNFTSQDQAEDIKDLPMIVMVNESSASASEIVSGALKDNDRAMILGTRSFGKGSVQQVKMLEANHGALKITNALYYLPSGRNIHRKDDSKIWGVDPNDGFFVPMTTDEMLEMLKVRREVSLAGDVKPGADVPVTDKWISDTYKDPQLAAAVKAITGKIQGGDWPKVGKGGEEVLAQAAELDRLMKARAEIATRLDEIDKRISKIEKGEKVEDEKKDEAKKE